MKKNTTPGTDTGTKKSDDKQFVVKTKGYSETFRNEADAKNQYDFLKKRSVKNQESIKIELSEKDTHGNSKTLENVTIGSEFFE